MKIKLTTLLLGLSLILQGQTEEASGSRTFTVDQAQQYALEHSYSLRNQQYEIEKAQKQILETASLFIPQVSASYSLQYNPIIQPVGFDASVPIFPGQPVDPNADGFSYITLGGGPWQTSAGVSANWLIGNYSNFLARRASEVLMDINSLTKEEAELQVNADVAKAFNRVLLTEESVVLLEEDLSSLQKSLFETRQLFQNGFVEEQDVDQIDFLASNINNLLENAKRQRVLAMQFLKFQMGIPLEEEIKVEGSLDESLQEVERELMDIESKQLDLENHVTYKIANTQYRGSVLQYKNEKADFYPTLGFAANYNNFYLSNDFDPVNFNTYWAPAAFVSGTITWNLFTGFANKAQAQQAEIGVHQAEVNKELTKSQIELNYTQARSDFLFALENYRNSLKNLRLTEKIRDRTRIKFVEGITSSLDLSQAETQYIRSQQDYIEALQGLINAKENLEQALGINKF